ncbi:MULTISPECIES: AraC family transcriptional regulator [Prauserella salsuginis group]|uniref:AraC family transcriptional regulator n=1 Tax=Prauserella salsuginis TaxID=387889 RepID=A0ABW6G0W6_9PSEU|nr:MULTISPECIES: AraC family transcriptional regulator [Prauserella salsuginis group]MCR3721988.1 Helix-turn-helix domain-containing protein [Prauserella flava]MCR3735994.1 Helix-turn-helix domain-containing protein [Prauserella salsuginis]
MNTAASVLPVLPSRYEIVRADGSARALELLSQQLGPFRIETTTSSIAPTSDMSAATIGPVSLIYLRHYGSDVRVEIPEVLSYYDVHFALAGTNRIDCADSSVLLGPSTGGIISPCMHTTMRFGTGYTQLHVRIDREALEKQLERMLGRTLYDPVLFNLRVDMTAPASATWVRTIALLAHDLDDPTGLGSSPEGASAWANFLIAGLLSAQPHNYSTELRRDDSRSTVPYRVRRVLALIESEPEADLSLKSLSAFAGVSERTLQRDFRTVLDVAPRQYVERVRLARAHDDLVHAKGRTVAEIANRWGFGHVPRFAAAFRRRYGRSPSAVLRGE